MKPSNQQILSFLKAYLPDFEPSGSPEELEGGNLNHVWRVRSGTRSVVVKHAPPYIAKNPEIPIDPGRLAFEANALALFCDGVALEQIKTDRVRPPKRLGFDEEKSMLVMEDIFPSAVWFDRVLKNKSNHGLAKDLGRFIGRLHTQTFQREEVAGGFRNLPIQKTRQIVQYESVANTLDDHGIHCPGAVQNAEKLGEKLLQPGKCLVMGDLWPPSILFKDGELRLIDWEFAHFGRPMQDVAHFAAHCYMYHTQYPPEAGRDFKAIWQNFLMGYRQGTGSKYNELLNRDEIVGMNIHFGAEILIRTIGPFREGYIFGDQQDTVIKKMVTVALERMNKPGTYADKNLLF